MKKKSISLKEALRMIISERHDKSAISHYEIKAYIYDIYQDKQVNGIKVRRVTAKEPSKWIIKNSIEDLIYSGFIKQESKSISSLNKKGNISAFQAICVLNPYCYISYLSAMSFHGITDRLPYVVHATTCSPSKYKEIALNKLRARYPKIEDLSNLIPPRIINPPPFDQKTFQVHQKSNFSLPRHQGDSEGIRVSSLGETFLDMIIRPEFCGGINHVIDVYKEYAEENLPIIVKYIEKHGSNIDKSRAGYLLEEVCHLNHRLIEKWKMSVSRGGSRKLLASEPYSDVYSETWCISINYS